jgi:integrase
MNDLQELVLDNYTRRLSDGDYRQQYIKDAKDFIEYSGGELTRDNVDGYMKKLQRKGLSESTRNKRFRQISTIFRRNNVEWPFTRGSGPQIREAEVNENRPAMDPAEIVKMIQAGSQSELTPEETAFVALSTIYGLRRVEMANLDKKAVKLKDNALYIATAKHGRERTHLIPDEIKPYLERYDFDTPMTPHKLFLMFGVIEYKIDLPHRHHMGWHSLRRTLDSLLLRRLATADVHDFLRWKKASSTDMTYRYSATVFVGRGGERTEVSEDVKSVDERVFEVHPFLHYWKGAWV